ncbi:MAG TPA: DUF167 domain-containing protein [Aquabacterium sp.]|uniref:DUF167 domain-containing protein n=1 Tax=Aquabacterium sp. TaxID=1872578 RepID=UPI002E2F9A1A|nr:DUF167 domain-containing protein [Aquabacterium sp.]HEX5356591.1 DUF167 domain-containing protein [Aquabacterium sp.]
MTTPAPSSSSWPCMRLDGKGKDQRVVLDISVSPNARKTELVGWHDGALRIRLSAPPVDGAANDALRKWLSKELGIPQNQVELLRGASGRRKQWALCIEPQKVEAWLAVQTTLQNS